MKTEVKVGEYGRMMFEMMFDPNPPEHWQSIKAEAMPLVQQLLALNDKMKDGGYKITGVHKKGKKVLSKYDRVKLARKKIMEVPAVSLKEGDLVWLHEDYDLPMDDPYQDPVKVEIVKGGRIIVGHPMGNRAGIYEIESTDKVLKAPDDWDTNSQTYKEDEYWLKKADELDI